MTRDKGNGMNFFLSRGKAKVFCKTLPFKELQAKKVFEVVRCVASYANAPVDSLWVGCGLSPWFGYRCKVHPVPSLPSLCTQMPSANQSKTLNVCAEVGRPWGYGGAQSVSGRVVRRQWVRIIPRIRITHQNFKAGSAELAQNRRFFGVTRNAPGLRQLHFEASKLFYDRRVANLLKPIL